MKYIPYYELVTQTGDYLSANDAPHEHPSSELGLSIILNDDLISS